MFDIIHIFLITSFMCFSKWSRSLSVKNEPVYNFEKSSEERLQVEHALKEVENHTRCIPIVIGGEEVFSNDIHYQVSVSIDN